MQATVTFMKYAERLASTRYRAMIPERELRKMGFVEGPDVLVAAKHGSWKWADLAYKKLIFDVSDDHFHTAHSEHYREGCKRADLITCPTSVMAQIIKSETGRDAVVIPDPYEQPEKKPRVHDQLLWFGHYLNLPDLEREAPRLIGHRLEVVSNAKGCTEWTPENMDAAFNRAGMVIIPTGKSMAKSANRAVESIRRGLFVVANPLPAYAELGIWQGDIPQGIEWALNHKSEAIKRVYMAQEYVRHEFSPKKIGELWAKAIKSV